MYPTFWITHENTEVGCYSGRRVGSIRIIVREAVLGEGGDLGFACVYLFKHVM